MQKDLKKYIKYFSVMRPGSKSSQWLRQGSEVALDKIYGNKLPNFI